ncbi:T9SS type A sorting domain-containing protein [Pedobacter sp. BS3]|uniref:T9SS type A sorting domain-containing protein n=1 Tax=Pedobacter sp. BS3 TaxID=2567937 RepID=UPI0011ED5E6E|nr:T9SS type A sorting domain-containing protein [Pedobacter sp. BS3]
MHLKEEIKKTLAYSVYAANGAVVSRGNINNNTSTLDLGLLNTGVYILKIAGYNAIRIVKD